MLFETIKNTLKNSELSEEIIKLLDLLDLLVEHNRNILKISKHRGCQCTKNAPRFGHDLHKAALVLQWPSKLRGERQDAVDHLVCLV